MFPWPFLANKQISLHPAFLTKSKKCVCYVIATSKITTITANTRSNNRISAGATTTWNNVSTPATTTTTAASNLKLLLLLLLQHVIKILSYKIRLHRLFVTTTKNNQYVRITIWWYLGAFRGHQLLIPSQFVIRRLGVDGWHNRTQDLPTGGCSWSPVWKCCCYWNVTFRKQLFLGQTFIFPNPNPVFCLNLTQVSFVSNPNQTAEFAKLLSSFVWFSFDSLGQK